MITTNATGGPAATEAQIRATAVRAAKTQVKARTGFETGSYPYTRKMARRTYEVEKAKLQAELLKAQHWALETGQKFVMLFEGRDAAGKGAPLNGSPSI